MELRYCQDALDLTLRTLPSYLTHFDYVDELPMCVVFGGIALPVAPVGSILGHEIADCLFQKDEVR